ncbi:MAG TPA: PAC2 family protein [Candidatus Thermoplasmatota archaeon]|nr:PAC2 family protein [Candidatus Thermoplasmatota archaeon]
MVSPMKVIEFKRQPYPTAMLVVGFPSHGLVGGITANFLIESLEMNLIGTVNGDALPPSVSVVDGVGVSPIQIWAGAERCGLDGECEQLLVVKSDAGIDTPLFMGVAEAILRWAKDKGIRLVVTLEGVNSAEASEDFVNVVGLVSPHARALLAREQFSLMGAGLVSGPSAAFMMKSLEVEVPVLGLLTSASADYPDAAASAKLLEALQPLVPHIGIDPEPLRRQAEQIEAGIKARMRAQREDFQKLAETQGSMYV